MNRLQISFLPTGKSDKNCHFVTLAAVERHLDTAASHSAGDRKRRRLFTTLAA